MVHQPMHHCRLARGDHRYFDPCYEIIEREALRNVFSNDSDSEEEEEAQKKKAAAESPSKEEKKDDDADGEAAAAKAEETHVHARVCTLASLVELRGECR